jgi:hypothetical protein
VLTIVENTAYISQFLELTGKLTPMLIVRIQERSMAIRFVSDAFFPLLSAFSPRLPSCCLFGKALEFCLRTPVYITLKDETILDRVPLPPC